MSLCGSLISAIGRDFSSGFLVDIYLGGLPTFPVFPVRIVSLSDFPANSAVGKPCRTGQCAICVLLPCYWSWVFSLLPGGIFLFHFAGFATHTRFTRPPSTHSPPLLVAAQGYCALAQYYISATGLIFFFCVCLCVCVCVFVRSFV